MNKERYLLDTCIIVNLFRGNDDYQRRIHGIGWKSCCTASACLGELYAGAFKRGKESEFRCIEWLREKIPCLPFDQSAVTYGRVRALLEQQGQRIEDMDIIMASIAIDNDLTLVTGNSRHFSRIPGLKFMVWD